jgi:S1-C subfamily serine protease
MKITTIFLVSLLSTLSSHSAEFDSYKLSNAVLSNSLVAAKDSKVQKYSLKIIQATAATDIAFSKSIDDPKTRGAAETAIYDKVSAGTVLVATEDAIGSGALISNNGFIVTNFHVVGDAKTVKIFFKPIGSSGDFKSAVELVGTVTKVNETNDLALVKVASIPSQARPIPLASLNSTKVGEDAHAIGHPRGEFWSYTRGYVSQIRDAYKWRASEGSSSHQADVVQTQTPINPGNSGGPLVNSSGKLIGLNSFGDPKSPGLNFAVATAEIEKFLKQEGSKRLVKAESIQNKKCGKEPVSEERRNLKDSGPATVINFDSNCKGEISSSLFIPDNISKPIVLVIYNSKTGKPAALIFDNNRDYEFDQTMVDTDGDGVFDMIGENKPGEIVASNLRKMS